MRRNTGEQGAVTGESKETQHSSLWMRLPGSGMRTLWRCERRRSMAAGGGERRRGRVASRVLEGRNGETMKERKKTELDEGGVK